MALQWSWIDGDMIRLPVEVAKSKKVRPLPIVGALEAIIQRRKRYVPLRLSVCLSPKRSADPAIPQGLQSGRQGNRL
jgi:hypothetical protein